MRGVITRLFAASLTLVESTGAERVFDEPSLRRIRLLYSPKHDALVGFTYGATWGALAGAFVGAGAGSGCPEEGCRILEGAAIVAGVAGGLGALIGAIVGAIRYPFNDVFDVYRRDARNAPAPFALTIAPQIDEARKGVLVSVRF